MKAGQGFLLVFSITSLASLSELSQLREQIIRIKEDPNVPIVIVGNKSDLEEHRVVSRAKAFAVSQGWGNAPYYETSARRRGKSNYLAKYSDLCVAYIALANVDEVFVDLCRQIIRRDTTTDVIISEEDMPLPPVLHNPNVRRDRRPHRHQRRRRKDSNLCTIL